MPVEYLAPGVHVEEALSGSRTIEGVSTSTTPYIGVSLHDVPLTRWTPAWTDRNDGDPGITLLDLMSCLAESLLGGGRTSSGGPRRLHAVVIVSETPFERFKFDLVVGALGRASFTEVEGLGHDADGETRTAVRRRKDD